MRDGRSPRRASSCATFLALLLVVTGTALWAAPRWALESPDETEVMEPVRPASIAMFDGAARTDDGRIQVLVELREPSAAVAFAEAMQGSAPNDTQALRFAGAVSQRQVAIVEDEQDAIAPALAGDPIQAREIYRVSKALNGIAVAVEPSRLRALMSLPGIKRVLPIYPEYPTNSTSVPFLGTPNVWDTTSPLPAHADGTGMRIGVIDTGIDYVHPNFGGSGLLADYTGEKTDTATFTTVGTAAFGSFPTTKVVGGTDFAGDLYNGNNAPVPDPNPMDCNGHGSHVSGTAAGLGVTSGGATYGGPWDNTTPFGTLRIGPGTAPKASLYGLRVFGCGGSTAVTVQAINWSMDPNGDADLSDHLDVINMSLGSNFGSAVNATSVASDNAAFAGVIVVASAGNAGDTFFISGAPGASTRTIATAASVDSGESAVSVRVNSPVSIAGDYLGGAAAFGPAPSGQTANGVIAVDPTNTTPAPGCGALSTDACCPLTNGAAMAGMICVVDRGTCSFKTKALNCQTAGAIGMVVVDSAPGSPPPGLADDPLIVTPITIPSERVSLLDGTSIKNTITSSPPVNITLLGANGADTLASFSSRGPRRIFGSPLRLKPDIAAPGLNITSTQTGVTCTGVAPSTGCIVPNGTGNIADGQSLTISGTSMASPHMAGIMALLRQLKPTWQVEELKALAMGYATHDVTLFPAGGPPKFGPSRVGAGRVDPSQSALGDVVAMNAEEVGLVSVTFEPEVVGVVTRTKKVRVVNKGTTDQTYDLAIATIVDSPGVSFSLPGGSTLTVGAGDTEELDVQMSADASLMDHTRDPSLFATQGVQVNYGDQPRNFLTEEGAYVTFSQSSTVKLRLPVYMAERPASTMSAADTIVTGGAGSGSTTIGLSGTDVCTGTLAAGPTCTGSFPTDVESLVSPFELQVVSGIDPVNSTDYADIHYVGASYLPNANGLGAGAANDLLMFGVASWGDWSTLNDVAYNICIDGNNDGVYEKIIYNANPAIFVAGASFNDNFVRIIRDTGTNSNTILGLGSPVNLVNPNVIDSALHLNNVAILAATPAQLGLAANPTVRYKVFTCPGGSGCARTATGNRCSPAAGTFFDTAAGPFVFNSAAPGLNFGGDFLDEDLNGNSLPVTWDTANMTTNGSLGALLLHHHNKAGTRAEVVLLDTAARANLAISKGVSLPTPDVGQNVTFTLTVTNNGPDAATGVVVNDLLPLGLTYVSDDGGGAYVAGTGIWTVGALAVSASATLNIVATVAVSGQICNQAVVSAGTPLDPSPVDNQATACVNAPRTADLLIDISASTPTVLVGDPVTFTVTVTNNGDDPAYALDTTEVFAPAVVPPGSYGGVTTSQGVFDPATGLWDLASLGIDATATLQYTIPAPNMAGNLTNTVATVSTKAARVRRKAFDPDTANNSDNVVVLVLSPASVTATKTVAGTFTEGSTVTYTIVLSNSAAFDQQNNSGPELTDVLPAQLTLTGADDGGNPGTFSNVGNTVNWDGVVPANGSVTITITATINSGTAAQTVSNQGTVNSDPDGNGTNEPGALTDDPGQAGAADPTSFVVAAQLTVTLAGTGTGTVNSVPVGINGCTNVGGPGGTCQAFFNGNTPVALTPTPSVNSSFVSWSGNCTGSSVPCNLTMDGNKAVTATFDLLPGLFYSVIPCRVLDTRLTGGPIASGETRLVTIEGTCGIPTSAVAVAINITAVNPTAGGHLTAYQGNGSLPMTSTLNFNNATTRANNAVVTLSTDGNGTVAIFVLAPGGQTDVVVDINGWFE